MAKRTPEGLRTTDFTGYKPAGRNYQPPENLDDMGQVIEMGLESLRKSRGQQARYANTPEGLEAFYQRAVSYFERINEINSNDGQQRVLPDFEGLAVWCGISRITLFNYENRGGQWAETIQLIKTLITACRKQVASTFKVPPMWEIFNLVNNSTGYRNTNQIVLSTDEMQQKQKEIELQDSLEANALTWDAENGEYIPQKGSD
jgi:hypothetical protein